MLHSNPSQQVKVGWRGTPFTFIAHLGLPPMYSHTCQTPWSVFLDGSVAPVPSANAQKTASNQARRSPTWKCVPPAERELTRADKVHRFETAESTARSRVQTGFLTPISSTL